MRNQIKSFFEQKIFYQMSFWVLFLFVQFFYFVSYRYWQAVHPDLVCTDIWMEKLLDIGVVLFFSAVLVSWSEEMTKERKEKRLLWVLPLFLVMVAVLVHMGFGVTVDGRCVSLLIGNLHFNYYFVAYVFLFLTIPKGVDALICCCRRFEILKMSLYLIVICGLCIIISGGLMLAATCGGFILAYYLYQSKNQLKYVVIIPFLLSIGYVCFYGVNGYFSFRFLENTWLRLTTGCVPLKEISFFLDGMEKPGTDIFWFCYLYPLAAVRKGLGDVAVIAMISMYLCMGILLWSYVNKFHEEKRAYRFLLVFMLAAWLGSILYELNIWSIKPFYATPFAGRLIDFIWLAIVYKIFYEKRE